MDKPISQQLSDLSVRAKKAEDEVASATKQGAENVQKREDEIKAAAAERKASLSKRASDAQDTVASAWSNVTNQVQSDVDGIRERIDYKKYEHDREKAAKAADQAEASAVRAINFALDSIDYAETAVLDAVLARETAQAI